MCLLFWYSRVRLGASPWRSCRDFCSAPQTHAYMCAVCKGFFFFFSFLPHTVPRPPCRAAASWFLSLQFIVNYQLSQQQSQNWFSLPLFIYKLLPSIWQVWVCVCGSVCVWGGQGKSWRCKLISHNAPLRANPFTHLHLRPLLQNSNTGVIEVSETPDLSPKLLKLLAAASIVSAFRNFLYNGACSDVGTYDLESLQIYISKVFLYHTFA